MDGVDNPAAGGRALAVEAAGLVKRFGTTRALAGLDLIVPPGTVYGLFGPNGAGKTTTVRILATLLAPDAGRPACSATTWCVRRPRFAGRSRWPASPPPSTMT